MKTLLSRRHFNIAAAASAATTLFAPAIARAQTRVLRLFTWEGYAEPELVGAFEETHGCTLKITYTGSVDEMFAKVQGSAGTDFDIVSFDTGSTARYADLNLVQALDPAKLPARDNLIEVFKNQPDLELRGMLWGVPHAWGSLPMIYDRAAFPDGAPAWDALWDPANAQQVIMLDDAINNTALAALVLGYKNPYQLSDEQLAAVKAKLIEIKGNLLTYFAGYDEGVSIFADNGIKLMFSMGEPQAKSLIDRGVDAAVTIPEQGGIGWIDCQFISAGARDVDLAHNWINACLDKSVATLMSTKVGYGNVLDDALNAKIGMTYADRLRYLAQPESYEKRIQLWNEVKAS